MHLKRPPVVRELPEEYTRVTNPERLLPLHDFAIDLFGRLANQYDVTESDEFELIGRMRSFAYARPPITLTPNSHNQAPISVGFTTFPSLVLRCGKFFNEPLPVCGCDACAPSVDEEADRLQNFLGPVIAGDFLEEIELPFLGSAHFKWRLGRMSGPHGLSSGGFGVSRDEARALRRTGFKRIQWDRWSRRT